MPAAMRIPNAPDAGQFLPPRIPQRVDAGIGGLSAETASSAASQSLYTVYVEPSTSTSADTFTK